MPLLACRAHVGVDHRRLPTRLAIGSHRSCFRSSMDARCRLGALAARFERNVEVASRSERRPSLFATRS